MSQEIRKEVDRIDKIDDKKDFQIDFEGKDYSEIYIKKTERFLEEIDALDDADQVKENLKDALLSDLVEVVDGDSLKEEASSYALEIDNFLSTIEKRVQLRDRLMALRFSDASVTNANFGEIYERSLTDGNLEEDSVFVLKNYVKEADGLTENYRAARSYFMNDTKPQVSDDEILTKYIGQNVLEDVFVSGQQRAGENLKTFGEIVEKENKRAEQCIKFELDLRNVGGVLLGSFANDRNNFIQLYEDLVEKNGISADLVKQVVGQVVFSKDFFEVQNKGSKVVANYISQAVLQASRGEELKIEAEKAQEDDDKLSQEAQAYLGDAEKLRGKIQIEKAKIDPKIASLNQGIGLISFGLNPDCPKFMKQLEAYYLLQEKAINSFEGITKIADGFVAGNPAKAKAMRMVLKSELSCSMNMPIVSPESPGKMKASLNTVWLPLNIEHYNKIKESSASALLVLRSNIYLASGDEKYRKYFDEVQNKTLEKVVADSDELLKGVEGSEIQKVSIQKHCGAIIGEFSKIQKERPGNLLQAYQDNANYLKALQNLRMDIGAEKGEVKSNGNGFVRSSLPGIGVGDTLDLINLKQQSPSLYVALMTVLDTHIEQSKFFAKDAAQNNPVMHKFRDDYNEVANDASGLENSFRNVVKQLDSSGDMPSKMLMESIHNDINRFRLSRAYLNLKSSDSVQAITLCKQLKALSGGVMNEVDADFDNFEQQFLSSQYHLQEIDKACDTLISIVGSEAGLEGFTSDALKTALMIAAGVLGATAASTFVAASGGAGVGVVAFVVQNVLISGGATLGSATAQSMMEGNMTAFERDNFLKSWATGTLVCGAAGLLSPMVGGAWGKGVNIANSAMTKSKFAWVRNFGQRGLNIETEGVLAKFTHGGAHEGSVFAEKFAHFATEFKEEIFEEGLEAVGRAVAPDDPLIGFAFSLMGSASGHARAIAHSGKFSPASGVEGTVTQAGIELSYNDPIQMRKVLQERGAPESVLEAFERDGFVNMESDGVRVVIGKGEVMVEEAAGGQVNAERLTGIDLTSLDVEKLNALLTKENPTADEIIAEFNKVPALRALLASDAGVGDKISIEIHVQRVIGQFEKYLASQDLPPGTDKNFYKLLFILHDIGKPIAIQKGTKELQHEETAPIMRDVLSRLGYSQQKIDLMVAIVDGDPVGDVVRKKSTPRETVIGIERIASRLNIPIDDFYQAVKILFMADASSYTSDAGGKGSLDKIFSFDHENGKVTLSPQKVKMLDSLEMEIQKIQGARDIGMITSSELNAYQAQHQAEVRIAAQDLAKLDPQTRKGRVLDMFSENKIGAIVIAEEVSAILEEASKGTEMESNLENIDRYRSDDSEINGTLERIEELRNYRDKDAQYVMLTLLYNENPALYVAAMERLTYDISTERSITNRDAKISQLLQPYSYEEMEVISTMQRRIEAEVTSQMLDTHGADLDSLFHIIEDGGLSSGHDRLARGQEIKGVAGDDIKLAGSLSTFSYFGSFWDAPGKDVLITFDHEYVDSQGADQSFYTTEDFVLKFTKDFDVEKEARRASVDEKLADVMARGDMKKYLSYRMAVHLFAEAKANGVPLADISRIDLVNGLASYVKDNSDITKLPDDMLGGRPEGHLKFEVPLEQMKIKVPRVKVGELLVKINKEIAKFEKKLDGRSPETMDRYSRREYNLLIAQRDRYTSRVAQNPGMTMRELVLAHIQETTDSLQQRLMQNPIDLAAKRALERIQKLKPDQISEFEIGGLRSDQDYRRREYLEGALGIDLSDQVAFDHYKRLQVISLSDRTHIYHEDVKFLKGLMGYLQEHNVPVESMSIKGNRLIVQNSNQSRDFASMARDYIEKHIVAPKPQPKQKIETGLEIKIDRSLVKPIVDVLNKAGLSKKDFDGLKGFLLKKGAEALVFIRKQGKLSAEALSQLETIFETGS